MLPVIAVNSIICQIGLLPADAATLLVYLISLFIINTSFPVFLMVTFTVCVPTKTNQSFAELMLSKISFAFAFLSNRPGLNKSDIQLVTCKGWREISNSTGHNPVEQIVVDTDHAQKVSFSSTPLD